jgi:hypothetical protein
MAAFDRRHVEPTAMFGGRMDLAFVCDSFGLRGVKGFRQRGGAMGIQLVHHEADCLDMRILLIHKCLDNVRPIHFRSLIRDFCRPLSSSRFKSHKKGCRTLSLLCRVRAERFPRLGWPRSTDFPDQLGRHCISAHVGILGVIRLFLDISEVLQVADTSGILLWRKTPCLLLPRFKCIFVHVRRMVSCDTESTIANSTIVSASIRKVHRS